MNAQRQAESLAKKQAEELQAKQRKEYGEQKRAVNFERQRNLASTQRPEPVAGNGSSSTKSESLPLLSWVSLRIAKVSGWMLIVLGVVILLVGIGIVLNLFVITPILNASELSDSVSQRP